MENEHPRIIVASNRLPVVLKKQAGEWKARPGTGGLVTALEPVLKEREGIWVGWPGVAEESSRGIERALSEAEETMGLRLLPVALSRRDIRGFYRGFSNEILWPLFHDLIMRCNFDSAYWPSYVEVNRKISSLVARKVRREDFIWVQDYHFLQLGQELRRRGVGNPLGFFLHTPFPAPDMFLRLPWRHQILQGLLSFDLVGFQGLRDRKNFLECVEALAAAELSDGSTPVASLHVTGDRDPEAGSPHSLRVGAFPISIDFEAFNALSESEDVKKHAARLSRELGPGQWILGVDRLDYTKGLPQKLRGFRRALERYPDLRERVSLIQHVVPSRESVPQYKDLRLQVERLVSEVNGKFGTPGWTPVRYFYKELSRPRLSAFYRMADVLLVTSLKDGMNLVSKEYCASKPEHDGVLVLSEFAGASSELRHGCLSINPYDVDGLAAAIYTAATMETDERRRRMFELRKTLEAHDVFHWVESFLLAANAPLTSPSSRRKRGRPIQRRRQGSTGSVAVDAAAATI